MGRFDDIAAGGGAVSVGVKIAGGLGKAAIIAWIASRWPWMSATEQENLYQLGSQAELAGEVINGSQPGDNLPIGQIPLIIGATAGMPGGTNVIVDVEIEILDPSTGVSKVLLVKVGGTGTETVGDLAQEAFQLAQDTLANYRNAAPGIDPANARVVNSRVLSTVRGA